MPGISRGKRPELLDSGYYNILHLFHFYIIIIYIIVFFLKSTQYFFGKEDRNETFEKSSTKCLFFFEVGFSRTIGGGFPKKRAMPPPPPPVWPGRHAATYWLRAQLLAVELVARSPNLQWAMGLLAGALSNLLLSFYRCGRGREAAGGRRASFQNLKVFSPAVSSV